MKKVKEIPTYKYFVSSVDTQLGHSICELIRNDFTGDKPPHTILGLQRIMKIFIYYRNKICQWTRNHPLFS